MKNNNNSKQIRTALFANAIFSGLCGADLLLFKGSFANIMGVTEPFILLIIGIGLSFFAILLLTTAFSKNINPKIVKLITAQDWAWVIGSIVILIGQFFPLTIVGNLLITIIALVVASFAIWQRVGLKRMG